MAPNTQYNNAHQDDTNPHELTHGFPNTLYHRVPSCKCRNLGREEEHGHESNSRKEYGVMQPVGPKTGVVWIVVEKGKSKTHCTQCHTGNEKRFGLILKYKLRIQVHIARSDWPNFIRVNWFFSVFTSKRLITCQGLPVEEAERLQHYDQDLKQFLLLVFQCYSRC